MMATKLGYQNILNAKDCSPTLSLTVEDCGFAKVLVCLQFVTSSNLTGLRSRQTRDRFKVPVNLLRCHFKIFKHVFKQNPDSCSSKMIVHLDSTDIDFKCNTLPDEALVTITHAVQQEGYDTVFAGNCGNTKWERKEIRELIQVFKDDLIGTVGRSGLQGLHRGPTRVRTNLVQFDQ